MSPIAGPRVPLGNTSTVTLAALDRYEVTPSGCWQWLGATDWKGYGKMTTHAADGRKSSTNAHRAFYIFHIGPIGDGLQLDHLCRNKGCVNPAHLEPVTNGVNVARAIAATRPACGKGHLFTPENTAYFGGSRRCRTCIRERGARYKRMWRANNPEKVRLANRKWREAHADEVNAKRRARRADNG